MEYNSFYANQQLYSFDLLKSTSFEFKMRFTLIQGCTRSVLQLLEIWKVQYSWNMNEPKLFSTLQRLENRTNWNQFNFLMVSSTSAVFDDQNKNVRCIGLYINKSRYPAFYFTEFGAENRKLKRLWPTVVDHFFSNVILQLLTWS